MLLEKHDSHSHSHDSDSDSHGDGHSDDGHEHSEDEHDDDEELEGGDENASTFDKIKIPVIIGVLLVAIILVIVVILFQLFAGGKDSNLRDTSSFAESSSVADNIVEMTEETTQETTEAQNKMPSLVGKNYDDIKDQIEEKYDITLDPEYEYNSDYAKNMIFWQELKIGEHVEKGMTVKVKVSKGTKKAVVPEYENWKLKDYLAMLDELGIEYTEVSEINFDFENDVVTRVSPEPGSEIDIQEGEMLTVYYADNQFITSHGHSSIYFTTFSFIFSFSIRSSFSPSRRSANPNGLTTIPFT